MPNVLTHYSHNCEPPRNHQYHIHIKVSLIKCKLTAKIILINKQIMSNLSTLTVKCIL